MISSPHCYTNLYEYWLKLLHDPHHVQITQIHQYKDISSLSHSATLLSRHPNHHLQTTSKTHWTFLQSWRFYSIDPQDLLKDRSEHFEPCPLKHPLKCSQRLSTIQAVALYPESYDVFLNSDFQTAAPAQNRNMTTSEICRGLLHSFRKDAVPPSRRNYCDSF